MRACLVVRVQCMCVVINWCWLWSLKLGLAFLSCALLMVLLMWECPLLVWPLTFTMLPSNGLAGALQSKVDAGTVWLEERLSVCERLLIMDLLHPCKKWVVWLWWGCGGMSSSVPFEVAQMCCTIGIVDFRWSVKNSWRMGLVEEQDGTIVGVFWTLPYMKCMPHPCSGHDWMRVVGYLLPHGCLGG